MRRPGAYVAAILASGALIVGLAWLTSGPVAHLLALPGVAAFDSEVITAIRSFATPWSVEAMTWVSRLHATAGILAASALLAAWLASQGRHALLLPLLASVPGGLLLNTIVKYGFQRARPVSDYAVERLTTYSFPSGHAASTACLYGFLLMLLWRAYPAAGKRVAFAACALSLVGLVAASRVMLGSHYPSDCVGAFIEAIAWLAICAAAARRLLPESETFHFGEARE